MRYAKYIFYIQRERINFLKREILFDINIYLSKFNLSTYTIDIGGKNSHKCDIILEYKFVGKIFVRYLINLYVKVLYTFYVSLNCFSSVNHLKRIFCLLSVIGSISCKMQIFRSAHMQILRSPHKLNCKTRIILVPANLIVITYQKIK